MATKVKNDILIGITLPYSKLENEKVLAIVESYKKENIIFVLISTIVFIPILFITYSSFQFLYLFLWIIAIIYGSNKVFIKYNRKLMNLKREKEWFRGGKHLITIDKKGWKEKKENTLGHTLENQIYTDDDEYWKNNVYNNPNDPRTMVEKRVGYGFEYNLATKKGKIVTYSAYAMTMVIPVIVLIMFFILDFSRFTLSVEDEVVKMNTPMYGTSFELKDIEKIELIDSVPSELEQMEL